MPERKSVTVRTGEYEGRTGYLVRTKGTSAVVDLGGCLVVTIPAKYIGLDFEPLSRSILPVQRSGGAYDA